MGNVEARALDGWVHRFHSGPGSATARGFLDVDVGASRAVRLLVRILRLPRPGAGQAARVHIARRIEGDATHEEWVRTVGAVTFSTRQIHTGDQVRERLGLLELTMRYQATTSDLWFVPTGAALALGRLRIRLPRFVAPRVCAHAWSSGDETSAPAFDVEVAMRLPLAGVLMSYRGHFTEETG